MTEKKPWAWNALDERTEPSEMAIESRKSERIATVLHAIADVYLEESKGALSAGEASSRMDEITREFGACFAIGISCIDSDGDDAYCTANWNVPGSVGYLLRIGCRGDLGADD